MFTLSMLVLCSLFNIYDPDFHIVLFSCFWIFTFFIFAFLYVHSLLLSRSSLSTFHFSIFLLSHVYVFACLHFHMLKLSHLTCSNCVHVFLHISQILLFTLSPFIDIRIVIFEMCVYEI